MTKPYREISLYHPEHGIKTKTRQEFVHLYGLSYACITDLLDGTLKTHKGWVLAGNKEKYHKLIKASRGINSQGTFREISLTLEHSEFGRHTLLATEFVRKFGLENSTLSKMRQGKIKKHKGWTIPKDN
jgi:hypothetical protein